MARTTETILQQMEDAQAAQPSLNELNSPSQSAVFKLWRYITSQVIQYFEQLVDLKKEELNKIALNSVVPSDAWLKSKVLEFQYGGIQNLQLVNFVPTYNPVDVTKRIISRCSVKTTAARTVTVKVAKGEPPAELDGSELAALKAYLTNPGNSTNGIGIGFAGIQVKATSIKPDRVFLEGEITYEGQYAGVIKATVINAINQYLIDISSLVKFDGNIRVLDLIDKIQTVPGVFDIKIKHLAIRPQATPFSATTYLIQNYTQIFTEYPTFAGYAIGEPAMDGLPAVATHLDFAEHLTFIAR